MTDAERYRDLAERVLGRSAHGAELSLTLDGSSQELDGRDHRKREDAVRRGMSWRSFPF